MTSAQAWLKVFEDVIHFSGYFGFVPLFAFGMWAYANAADGEIVGPVIIISILWCLVICSMAAGYIN